MMYRGNRAQYDEIVKSQVEASRKDIPADKEFKTAEEHYRHQPPMQSPTDDDFWYDDDEEEEEEDEFDDDNSDS